MMKLLAGVEQEVNDKAGTEETKNEQTNNNNDPTKKKQETEKPIRRTGAKPAPNKVSQLTLV